MPGVCFSSVLMHICPTGNMYVATEPQTEVENTRLVFEKCGKHEITASTLLPVSLVSVWMYRVFGFMVPARLHCSWERPGFGDMDWTVLLLGKQRVLDLR